jgi:nucleotidyltransferase/DNA polymerase involved in DNA repair
MGMARQARGIDERVVRTDREPKSVSQERTFGRDLSDVNALQQQLLRLSQGVSSRLKRKGWAAGTVVLKLRYADFTTISRQARLSVPTDDEQVIYQTALSLFHRVWRQGQAIRLLGVGGRHLSPPVGQMPLLLVDDPQF